MCISPQTRSGPTVYNITKVSQWKRVSKWRRACGHRAQRDDAKYAHHSGTTVPVRPTVFLVPTPSCRVLAGAHNLSSDSRHSRLSYR